MPTYILKKKLRSNDVSYSAGDEIELTEEAAKNLADKGYVDLTGNGPSKAATKAERRKRAKELVRDDSPGNQIASEAENQGADGDETGSAADNQGLKAMKPAPQPIIRTRSPIRHLKLQLRRQSPSLARNQSTLIRSNGSAGIQGLHAMRPCSPGARRQVQSLPTSRCTGCLSQAIQTRISGKARLRRPWQRAAKEFLAEPENQVCKLCGCAIATQVDHIIPHRGDPKLFWDRNNCQGACRPCHSRKTRRGQ